MYFIVFGLLRGELGKIWHHDNNCTFIFVVCKEKRNFAKIIMFVQPFS